MKSPRFAAISLLLAVVSLTTAVHGQSPALEIRRAGDAIRRGDHAAALRTLRPLRSKHPENADIPRFLALAYGGLGRYDEARAAAIDALSLGRFSPDVLGNLARVDRERDDRVALLNTVRILVVLDPRERRLARPPSGPPRLERSAGRGRFDFRDAARETPSQRRSPRPTRPCRARSRLAEACDRSSRDGLEARLEGSVRRAPARRIPATSRRSSQRGRLVRARVRDHSRGRLPRTTASICRAALRDR